jgi:prepilin-type N-terminal cleavage/methylation domain-containing protein
MKKGKGFTLIEFMVAAVVFSLFTFTLYNLFAGGLRAYKKGETITLLKKNATHFLDWLSTDFHAAYQNPTVSGGGTTLSLTRLINGTGGQDWHSITYTYSATNGTITRDDTPTTTTYTEEGDITFGGDENIYFYTGGTAFTFDTSSETLTVDFYTQSGKTYDNQAWKRLRLVNTYSKRYQYDAFNPSSNTNYATKVMNGNDAIDDPGSPPDRIKFLK